MVRKLINEQDFTFMKIFERITRVFPKGCFLYNEDKGILFIVPFNSLGKAVGKKALNVKVLEKQLRKKIRIIEYNSDLEKFISNLVYPYKIKSVELKDNGVALIKAADFSNRGFIIGKNASNLKFLKHVVKRFFNDVENIVVLKT
jgi:NusA-like KH domain protein